MVTTLPSLSLHINYSIGGNFWSRRARETSRSRRVPHVPAGRLERSNRATDSTNQSVGVARALGDRQLGGFGRHRAAQTREAEREILLALVQAGDEELGLLVDLARAADVPEAELARVVVVATCELSDAPYALGARDAGEIRRRHVQLEVVQSRVPFVKSLRQLLESTFLRAFEGGEQHLCEVGMITRRAWSFIESIIHIT